MTENPFNPQDPTSPPYFYGRKRIIERYKENLNQSPPMNLMLVGDWGIGKTSTLHKLEALNTEGVATIWASITNEEEKEFENFVFTLLKHLRERFNRFGFDWKISEVRTKLLKAERREKKPKDLFMDKMQDIWRKASSEYSTVVLFLDDFDLMYPHQQSIRNCFQDLRHDECKYMLVATSGPEVLAQAEQDEPFVRFFDRRDLERFDESDTIGMVQHIIGTSGLEVDVTDDLLEEVHKQTQGHPYYVTLFMHEIIRKKSEGVLARRDLEDTREEIMRGIRTHLSRKYNSLTEREIEAIRACVRTKSIEFSPKELNGFGSDVCQQLCSKDVLQRVGYGRYKFHHPMTRQHFQEKL